MSGEWPGEGSMKVLVVDDHEVNRMLPLAHLKRLGVETVQAADGQAALDRLAEDTSMR